VGYVPVLKPLIGPFDDPVVAVPVPVELPTLLEPATPVAAAPLVPPAPAPAPPVSCAKALDEVTARTEVRAIVVNFMWVAVVKAAPTVTSKANGPSKLSAVNWGRPEVVPLGEPAHIRCRFAIRLRH
jgi:hypothetical protein